MKKLFFSLVLSLLFVNPVFASSQLITCESREIYHTEEGYLLEVDNVNDKYDHYVLYLFDAVNDNLVPKLNDIFIGKQVIVEYDDMNTKNIDDDEIIGFTLLN